MDEGRKRVIGIMAAILASLHMQTADDLFGGPQGSPRTDSLIAASIQWAERIMEKIDEVFGADRLENEYQCAIHEIFSVVRTRFPTLCQRLWELHERQDIRDKAVKAFYEHKKAHARAASGERRVAYF